MDSGAARLARLRWALRSQAARADAARRRLDGVEAPHAHEASPPPARRISAGVTPAPAQVVPSPAPRAVAPLPSAVAPVPRAVAAQERRLRVVVSEQRQVSVELESRIGAPAPGIDPRNRLAS